MQAYPTAAVVILNWNGKQFLEKFLPSVMASTYPGKKIIVADNASTDDSLAFLAAAYPAVQVIRNSTNEGFAGGYNTALAQVEADYFVLLNSDVEVTPGWMEPVIALMEADPSIGACQPKLLAYNDKKMFEYAGACGGWLDVLGYPFSRGRVFDVCEQDQGQYEDAAPCFWASGAAMFVRAAVYRKTGGLDTCFFAHQEEIDLCWRIQHAGYKVYVQPAAVVYHVGGGTLPKGNSRKVFLNFRNNLVMMSKNLPLARALYRIPLRIALDGVAAWRSLLGGDAGAWLAIAKAHAGYCKWLLGSKDRRFMPPQKSKKVQGVYSGSVVWQHFVKGKKSFSEIVGRK